MTAGTFIRRGLRYFSSSYAGVVGGAALGAMVLLGALFAGDSVRATLRQDAQARIGKVSYLLAGGDRFFRAALADDLVGEGFAAAPVLLIEGTVSAQTGGRSTGRVQVVGVDARFWGFGPAGARAPEDTPAAITGREVYVNDHLASTLGVADGETVVMRFAKPGLISRDAPMSGSAESIITIRGTVRDVIGADRFGRFSLEASQLPRSTVFVPIERLQETIEAGGRANLMLLGDGGDVGLEKLAGTVEQEFTLDDYGLSLVDVPPARATEIRTARVFFDRRMAGAIETRFPGVQPVITYLANTIAANGRETPYSMVTAAGREAAPFLPEDGAVLNAWIAEDLAAKVGDTVSISYYAVSGGSRLEERTAQFRVGAVTPMEGLPADPEWMPDFPGVSEAESTGDWSPGLP
ncbi:MAG: hypothetical protein HKO57_00215, partial [Akkermansiaceae bacterium]|nr:hypothetical protein [Akkermansiaceae bacterium]